MSRIIPVFLVLGFWIFNGGVSWGQSLEAIDSFFAQNNEAIRTEINGREIQNASPIYYRIVNQRKGRKFPGGYAENRRVASSYDYYGALFEGRVFLNNVQFLESFDFTLTEFSQPITLQTSTFNKPALFNWACFRSLANFLRVRFNDGAQFTRVIFDSSSNFKLCRFNGDAFFFGSQFNGPASFNDSRFESEAIFSFTEFHEKVSFNRVEFATIARFNNILFEKNASFHLTNFDSLADFSNAAIGGGLDFSGAIIPRRMDFSGMQEIEGFVDLLRVYTTNLKGDCMINLYNADISKFRLNYDAFSLYFPEDATYKEKVKVYEDLLENFKANEQDESYEKLDIEFSQFKYREKRDLASNFIQKAWWNYGYDKNMIFVWIFRILIFFSVINTFFIRRMINAISELPFLTRKAVEKHSLHHPIIAYCLNFPGTFLYTVIMILSGATGLSIIKDHTRIPNVVWMLYMIILSLIGFSLSLFIFNYIIN